MEQESIDRQLELPIKLKEANLKLAELLDGYCIFIHSVINSPLDERLRELLEIVPKAEKKDRLIVLLQTFGGSFEIVERLVNTMRHNFKEVYFIVPNFALSAGTVLVLSGDEIYMDYFSVLGPIDPQVPTSDGRYISGLGKIWEIEQLLQRINRSQGSEETDAESALLRSIYNHGEYASIRQNIRFGEGLIKKYLPKYKFKNWVVTETGKVTVTDQMKLDRAEKISQVLGNVDIWHSHGRGITMERLMEDDIKLKINDYSLDSELKFSVGEYYNGITRLLEILKVDDCIHTNNKLWRI